jgi:hypothetical protein
MIVMMTETFTRGDGEKFVLREPTNRIILLELVHIKNTYIQSHLGNCIYDTKSPSPIADHI